jgi:hypothetical protein
LELAELVEDDGESEVNVRRRGVDSELDPQRPTGIEPSNEVIVVNELLSAELERFELA